jgi:hypothetical protein
MWITGKQDIIIPQSVNKELLGLRGELDISEARITLAKFLRNNVGIAAELLLGIKLEKYQELTIKGFFNRNYSMLVWGRGGAKSFCAAVFCILQCIFEPGTKIIIASANFRTARRLFMEVDKILNSKGAFLAKQCFGKPNKRNDEYLYPVVAPSSGSIIAVPLSGENLRGYRASVLIIDEFLLIPKDTVERVLMPFLNSPMDVADRIKIREIEDDLIRQGRMNEANRMNFKNANKMLTLSSASFTFEYLYETFSLWSNIIENPDILKENAALGGDNVDLMRDSTYFVSQMSYESMPAHMLDTGAIQLAKNGGMSASSFSREYEARFVDGGDGYFSPKKMMYCTVPNGEYPTARVVGDPTKKYILAVDPNLSSSKTADYFAMSVMELDEENQMSTLVHGYQKAGGSVQDHIKYLYFLIKNFNIVMIVLDSAGGDQFIEAANASVVFSKEGKTLKFFDFNPDKEGHEYQEMLQNAKQQYNLQDNRICYKQFFTSTFLRKANEYLQTCIDHKRVWFASQVCAHPDVFKTISQNEDIPFDLVFPKGIDDAPDDAQERTKVGVRDFLEQQDFIIRDTKEQCALVKVTTTARGTQTFDLPMHLRKLSSINKPRKDNYSTLMLGNWGARVYYDLFSELAEKSDYYDFQPFFVN